MERIRNEAGHGTVGGFGCPAGVAGFVLGLIALLLVLFGQ